MSNRIAVLHGGQIQQLDAPRVIYEHPRTKFVANFVGSSNLFDGNLDGSSLRMADGTSIALKPRAAAPATGPASAMIRPENFSLTSSPLLCASITVQREQVVFAGSSFDILAHLPSGQKVMATIPGSERARISTVEEASEIALYYDPAGVHLLFDPHGERSQ